MPGFIVVTPLVLLINDGRRWRANKSLFFFFFLLSLFGEDGLIGATGMNFTTLLRERRKIQESEASITSMAWTKILQKLCNKKTFFTWKKMFWSKCIVRIQPLKDYRNIFGQDSSWIHPAFPPPPPFHWDIPPRSSRWNKDPHLTLPSSIRCPLAQDNVLIIHLLRNKKPPFL